MKTLMKSLAVALASAALLTVPLAADARGGPGAGGAGWHGGGAGHRGGGSWHGGGWGHPGNWRGGYWGPGAFLGGIGIGLGIGAIGYYGSPYYGYGYGYPGYVVSDDPGYVVPDAPVTTYVAPPPSGQPVPSSSRAPEPIFYPRNKQSAAQTEADRQDCNRWATTQTGAMNDASIFQRATYACMEGRGYTVR
jgi:hypothetical protein